MEESSTNTPLTKPKRLMSGLLSYHHYTRFMKSFCVITQAQEVRADTNTLQHPNPASQRSIRLTKRLRAQPWRLGQEPGSFQAGLRLGDFSLVFTKDNPHNFHPTQHCQQSQILYLLNPKQLKEAVRRASYSPQVRFTKKDSQRHYTLSQSTFWHVF